MLMPVPMPMPVRISFAQLQVGTLPTEYTYEQLLGSKLIECGERLKAIETTKALPSGVSDAGVPYVVFLFGEGKNSNSIRVMEVLEKEATDRAGQLIVVYISEDANKMEFDRFLRKRSAQIKALPYRSTSHNRRARTHFAVSGTPTVVVTKINEHGYVALTNSDAALQVLNQAAFPWRQQSLLEELGDTLVDRDRITHATEDLLGKGSKCQVLALYFGGDWCPVCRSFLPTLNHVYNALKREYDSEFEVVYVSSDHDIDDFDERQRKMNWYSVPYEDYNGRQVKQVLSARFRISYIPTVILLHRFGRDAEFTLIPEGRDGVGRLSQSVDNLVADFPRWKAPQLVLTLDTKSQVKWNRSVSLIVLCEHLSPDSESFRALFRAMTSVARAFNDENEARSRARLADRRAGRPVVGAEWPRAMCFFVAPSPPNEATRFLRQQYANLPVATLGKEALVPLMLDLRTTSPFHACYSMSGVCEVELRPQPTLEGLCEEGGKRLTNFVETFCNKLQPLEGAASPDPRVCSRISD